MSNRRSANTCAECRARKVKCDGRRNVCSPCGRLQLRCSFTIADPANAIPDPRAISGERRARAACKPCQILKVRCSGGLPKCERCVNKHDICLYPGPKRIAARPTRKGLSAESLSTTALAPSGLSSSASSNADVAQNALSAVNATSTTRLSTFSATEIPTEIATIFPSLKRPTVLRLLEAFFEHIQPIPVYSFFHKASLMHRFERSCINPDLLLALVGTVYDMLETEASMKEFGRECLCKAEALVMEDIKTPSAMKIQTIILVIQAHCRQGQITAGFMLFAIAARFAHALRLNHEAPRLCYLEQESRRRLMWSLFIVDTRLAGGIREFSLCSADAMHIQLPCQERNFELGLEQITVGLHHGTDQPSSENVGSLAVYLRIFWLRHRVLQMTKEAIFSQAHEITQLPPHVDSLTRELSEFEANLPVSLQFSKRNLRLRAYSPRLYTFVLIHLWLRQCYCDLYRVFLIGLKESITEAQACHLDPNTVSNYRWKCYESAKKMSDFLDHIKTIGAKLPKTEHDIPICAYQCVRLLLQCSWRCGYVEGQLTEDILERLLDQCVAAVEAVPSTSPIGVRVERDLHDLIKQGRSSSASPGRAKSPVDAGQTGHRPLKHLFSKHNLLGQMCIRDDQDMLTIQNDLDHEVSGSAPRTRPCSPTPVTMPSTEPDIVRDTAGHQNESELFNSASLDTFHSDLDGLFDMSIVDMDLFGWSGELWTNHT